MRFDADFTDLPAHGLPTVKRAFSESRDDVFMDPLDHIELVELVTDGLDEAVDSGKLSSLLDHLRICEPCDVYLDEVLVTLKILTSIPRERLSARLESDLLAIYRKWTESGVAA